LLSEFPLENPQIFKLSIEYKIVPMTIRPPFSKMTCLVCSLCTYPLGLERPFYLKSLQQLFLPPRSRNITRNNKNINSGVNFPDRNHEKNTHTKQKSPSLSSDSKATLSPYMGYSVRSSCRNLWTLQVRYYSTGYIKIL